MGYAKSYLLSSPPFDKKSERAYAAVLREGRSFSAGHFGAFTRVPNNYFVNVTEVIGRLTCRFALSLKGLK